MSDTKSDIESIIEISRKILKTHTTMKVVSTKELKIKMALTVINESMNDTDVIIYKALVHIGEKSMIVTIEEMTKLMNIFNGHCVKEYENSKNRSGEDLAFLCSLCFRGNNTSDDNMMIMKIIEKTWGTL